MIHRAANLEKSDRERMRLQRFLARAGVASRRACETIIADGRVTVNGVVAQLGSSVDPESDVVLVDGVAVSLPAGTTVLMLHKPAGFTSTMSDAHAERTVVELVPADRYPGLFPLGRLDVDTSGLLLFATDGDLGNALLHPRSHVVKEYVALVEGRLSDADAQRLAAGVELSDGLTLPAEVRIARGDEASRCALLIGDGMGASGLDKRHGGGRSRRVLERNGTYVVVRLREGRNRQVRRMMEAVGHPVIALHRESFGALSLGGLERGSWRELTAAEVQALRAVAGA